MAENTFFWGKAIAKHFLTTFSCEQISSSKNHGLLQTRNPNPNPGFPLGRVLKPGFTNWRVFGRSIYNTNVNVCVGMANNSKVLICTPAASVVYQDWSACSNREPHVLHSPAFSCNLLPIAYSTSFFLFLGQLF